MAIKAVFFDLYNTLLGYKPPREQIQADACREFGIEVQPADLRRPITVADEYIYGEFSRVPMGQHSPKSMKQIWLNYERLLLKEAGFNPPDDMVMRIMGRVQQVQFENVLFDDVIPEMETLKKKGIKLGLVSNIDKDITPMLDKLGLTSLLDVVVTSKDAGATKPDPRIFQAAVRRIDGISPAEAIYVGDQYEVDALGACRAGLKGVFLDRGDFFKDAKGCARIITLSGLTGLLDQ